MPGYTDGTSFDIFKRLYNDLGIDRIFRRDRLFNIFWIHSSNTFDITKWIEENRR